MSWYAVTFDCAEPSSVADFWAAALGPWDCRLLHRRSRCPCAAHGSPEPRIVFNRVPEPKTVKNRVHIDIATTDFALDAGRLAHLGATRMADYDFEDSRGRRSRTRRQRIRPR